MSAVPVSQPTAPVPQPGYIPSAQSSTPPDFNQTPVVVQGAKRPFRVTRGMTIGVLAVAAVVAVAIIAFAVTGIFGGSGANSPEGVANRLGAVYTDLLQSDFDEAALTRFGNDALDLLHPSMVEESIRSTGYHSRDEYAEGFGERYGSAFASLGSISEYVDFTVDIRVGDKLTSYQLATVNDSLARYGIEATDGYKLGGTMTATVLRDFSRLQRWRRRNDRHELDGHHRCQDRRQLVSGYRHVCVAQAKLFALRGRGVKLPQGFLT